MFINLISQFIDDLLYRGMQIIRMNLPQSPQSTQKNEKKKLTRAQQLKEDSEKFMQRPSPHIINPNKDLKQSYDKGFFKDKRFDHLRYLKKIRSKAQKDSISSGEDDDQEYSIEKKPRRNRKKQNSDEDKPEKRRARKPKIETDNNNTTPLKQTTFSQQPVNEAINQTQIVKKRGRPKGSLNKNKKQNEKKQQQKKMKQFECLKRIEPKQKEASSLQDQSQSESEQEVQEKVVSKIIDGEEKVKQNKSNENNINLKNQQASQEQEDQSQSQQQSEQQESQEDKLKEQQINNKQNNRQQQEQSSDESQDSSQSQKKFVGAHQKSQPQKLQKQKQAKINQKFNKMQESLAPFRGKRLIINSSSPSQNSQIAANKNDILRREIATENTLKQNEQKNAMVFNNELLPQQQQLNKLIKKRGRKSYQTQAEIQRLKQVIYQKKNNIIIFEGKKQKLQQQAPRVQTNNDESQSYYKQFNQSKRKSKIVSSMYPTVRNQQKPFQYKNIVTSVNQQTISTKPIQGHKNVIDRIEIQKQIMSRKIKKLAMQSKIYSEEIYIQEPIDPQQQKLFKAWTKYYKKFNQAVVAQYQQEEDQHPQSHRKKPPKQKFKRYRKVIIEESCDDFSDQGHRTKKTRKQKRVKQPRVVFHEKKSKSKRKHRESSSSESNYD